MAISFVAAGAVATGTDPTVAVPAGYQHADLLVLVIAIDAAVAPGVVGTWTLVGSQTTAPRIYIYRKFADGVESNLSITSNSSTTAAVMLAYRGVSATDTVSAFNTATATTVATNTLTTTHADEYVVSVYAMAIGAATWTAPGSTTSRVNSAGTAALAGVLVVDELQAAAGTSTARTATSSVSKALAAGSFSIIPSGRYWVGGTGTWDTTSTTNWAFSSGGASGAPVPTAQDSVFFDQAGTYTVTCTGITQPFLDITTSAGTVTFSGTGSFAVHGSVTFLAGTVWSGTGGWAFQGTATGKTITTNGVTLPITFNLNSASGGWTLGSALTVLSLNIGGSTFSTSASNYSVTVTSSVSVSGGTFNLNGSTVTLTGTGGGTPFTYTAGTISGTGTISLTSASAKTFVGGGVSYTNITLNQGGSGALTITGSNTFSNITNSYKTTGATTITFTAGTTTTVSDFTASGESGRVLTINSTSAGSAATLSKASGTVNADFLNISDSTATGGATWNATNSTDGGNNSGWIITAPPPVNGNFFMFF